MSKKVFISVLLLLTYSLGFTHNFIPHHHDAETKIEIITHEKNSHRHHHHSSGEEHLNTNHEHIPHGNHYDEGIYDLIICFLHKANHQEEDCKDQYFLLVESNRFIISKTEQNEIISLLFSIALETKIGLFITYDGINSDIAYLSPSTGNTPLRGPPSIS